MFVRWNLLRKKSVWRTVFTIVENENNFMRIERQKFLCVEKVISTLMMKKYIMANKNPGGDRNE